MPNPPRPKVKRPTGPRSSRIESAVRVAPGAGASARVWPPERAWVRANRTGWLAPLASELASLRGEPVLLTGEGPQGVQVVLAVPESANLNAGKILRALIEPCGGKGGGSDRLAQGRVPLGGRTRLLEMWQEGAGA